MKNFTRLEPTTIYTVGDRFPRQTVIKRYATEDGLEHEFTTSGTEHRLAAAVIALTTDYRVIISRQFRAGRERYLDDLPGGAVEDSESTEVAVRRELLEEAGYESSTYRYLGHYGWDAYLNLTSHYFLATECIPALQRKAEQIEADQGLETQLISIEQLIENARTDQMCDAVAVLMAYDALQDFITLRDNNGGKET